MNIQLNNTNHWNHNMKAKNYLNRKADKASKTKFYAIMLQINYWQWQPCDTSFSFIKRPQIDRKTYKNNSSKENGGNGKEMKDKVIKKLLLKFKTITLLIVQKLSLLYCPIIMLTKCYYFMVKHSPTQSLEDLNNRKAKKGNGKS